MPEQTLIAFDLYGTLLSTDSVAKKLAEYVGDAEARNVATLWRRHQLEYTWRCNSMDLYIPFDTITRRALLHALHAAAISLKSSQIEAVLTAYDSLSTFPDVPPLLDTLRRASNVTSVIFSNGTQQQLVSSIEKSPDLSPHKDIFKAVVTVDEVKKFKPAKEVYRHLATNMGYSTSEQDMGQLVLVSGNPFDVVGAKSAGMKAVWVDRERAGWVDELMGEEGRPDWTVDDLKDVVQIVKG